MSEKARFVQLRVFGPWHIRRTVCYGDWTLCGRSILDRDEKTSEQPAASSTCKSCQKLAKGVEA